MTKRCWRQGGFQRYGFIIPDGGGNDIFVHISTLVDSGLSSLNRGQKVTFDLEQNQKSGIEWAVKIRLLQ